MSDLSALNQALVDELRSKGLIQSPEVEATFRAVLRHHFLPGTPPEQVYYDQALVAKVEERLVKQVQAWEAAGRPSSRNCAFEPILST